MFALEKRPLVDCDLEEVARLYAARSGRAADRFITSAEEAIRAAGREPLRYRERFEDVRPANLAGFPYGVFFVERGPTVHVLAVMHAARDHRAVLDRRPPVI
ncbi:MAG: type II toxin-antitoxin system RelE/ParE family toxin [Chthoniobacteraceae bacterium]